MVKYTTRPNSRKFQRTIEDIRLEIEQHIDPDQGSRTWLIEEMECRTLEHIRQDLVQDQNSFLGSGDEDA